MQRFSLKFLTLLLGIGSAHAATVHERLTYQGQESAQLSLRTVRIEHDYATRIGETTCYRTEYRNEEVCEWVWDNGSSRYEYRCERREVPYSVGYPCIGEIREIVATREIPVRRDLSLRFNPSAPDLRAELTFQMDDYGKIDVQGVQSAGRPHAIYLRNVELNGDSWNGNIDTLPLRLPTAEEGIRSATLNRGILSVDLGAFEEPESLRLIANLQPTSGRSAELNEPLLNVLMGASTPARVNLDMAARGFRPTPSAINSAFIAIERRMPSGALNAKQVQAAERIFRWFTL